MHAIGSPHSFLRCRRTAPYSDGVRTFCTMLAGKSIAQLYLCWQETLKLAYSPCWHCAGAAAASGDIFEGELSATNCAAGALLGDSMNVAEPEIGEELRSECLDLRDNRSASHAAALTCLRSRLSSLHCDTLTDVSSAFSPGLRPEASRDLEPECAVFGPGDVRRQLHAAHPDLELLYRKWFDSRRTRCVYCESKGMATFLTPDLMGPEQTVLGLEGQYEAVRIGTSGRLPSAQGLKPPSSRNRNGNDWDVQQGQLLTGISHIGSLQAQRAIHQEYGRIIVNTCQASQSVGLTNMCYATTAVNARCLSIFVAIRNNRQWGETTLKTRRLSCVSAGIHFAYIAVVLSVSYGAGDNRPIRSNTP